MKLRFKNYFPLAILLAGVSGATPSWSYFSLPNLASGGALPV
ncbi:hypothetical protein MHM_03540 [Candidatus Mycoplasma haemominutum 'Birmingham 1']|uniref:Uncharacterized protein n=1 Tax=Candidatus Mycoplasma haematominutum 'Birmingham 1' TaxID=1116213 RepID=G8C3H4_9MOLU|nr:hypothetical protein MHM_03540 [Candidatus Mycoplasma haematominutum 'Birmingham 1']